MTLFIAGPGTCAREEKYRACTTRTVKSNIARSANIRRLIVKFWMGSIVCMTERAPPVTATCCLLVRLF